MITSNDHDDEIAWAEQRTKRIEALTSLIRNLADAGSVPYDIRNKLMELAARSLEIVLEKTIPQ